MLKEATFLKEGVVVLDMEEGEGGGAVGGPMWTVGTVGPTGGTTAGT